MLNSRTLYPYDSSDDEDGEEALSFSRAHIQKTVKKVDAEDYPLVASYILTETAQSLLHNPDSHTLYSNNKAAIHQQLKITAPEFADHAFYRFVPSLVVYSKSKDDDYQEKLFKAFYNKFQKEINAFVRTKYLSDSLDLDTDIVGIKAAYQTLITRCVEDLQTYHQDNAYSSDNITAIEGFEPNLYDKLKNELQSGKRTHAREIKPSVDKALKFLEDTIKKLSPKKFFEFLEQTKSVDLSVIKLDQSTIPELLPLLIFTKDLDLFLVQELLLDKFDSETYITEHYIINARLKKHLSEHTFYKSFYEHAAAIKLDHKIIRHTEKLMAFQGVRDVVHHDTELASEASTSYTIKLYASGSRSDYVDLPLKGNSTAYASLVGNGKHDIGELEGIVYSSELAKAIFHNQVVCDGNWKSGFLYRFTDLLFNCEPARGVSAYLTNAMFFELVDASTYTIHELPDRLPVAIKTDKNLNENSGAVDAYRELHDMLGGTYGGTGKFLTTRSYYDHKKGNEDKALELMVRDTVLFFDWLIHKKVLNGDSLIDGEIKLSDAVEKAYNLMTNLRNPMLYNSQSMQLDLKNIISTLNIYLAKIVSADAMKDESKSGKEEETVEENDDDQDVGMASTLVADSLFKALHNLIYEWYGVHLEHLYSAEQFEQDQRKQFIEEKFNITSQADLEKALVELEAALKDEESNSSKAFEQWKLDIWKYTGNLDASSSMGSGKGFVLPQTPTENAFNQRYSLKYCYQASDIKAIQSVVMSDYADKFVMHQPIGNNISIDDTLKALIDEVNPVKPTLCVYNLGNWHWVFFAAVKIEGVTTILYKDSKGTSNPYLEEKLKSLDGAITFIIHEGKEQVYGVDCGIFAIQNMLIMAKFLLSVVGTPQEQIIKAFSEQEFCTLNKARELREQDFAIDYVTSQCQQILHDNQDLLQRAALKAHHEGELDRIKEALDKREPDDIEIIVLKGSEQLATNDKKKAAIEIALPHDLKPDSAEYVYSYRITHTKDLETAAVRSIFGLEDDPSNNEVIRIPHTDFNGKIEQVDRIELRTIATEPQEITLEELCKDLSISSKDNTAKKLIETAMKVALEGEFSGKYENIGWIDGYFARYTLEALSNILHLELEALNIDNVEVLEGVFLDSDNNNIAALFSIIKNSNSQTTLLPINLFNKHAVGLVFNKSDDGRINIQYLDSLNKPILKELETLLVEHFGNLVNCFQQFEVEKQKYGNCGSELVENFMLCLYGERLSQEEAVEAHSRLVEHSLVVSEFDTNIRIDKEQQAFVLPLELLGVDNCGIEVEG